MTINVLNGGVVTLQPSSPFLGDGTTNIFEISGVFLSWGYTPQHTTISGITIKDFPGSGIHAQSSGIVIQGCTIMYNGADGVRIDGGSNNLIGGTESGQGNIIAYNGGNGIAVRKHEGFPTPLGNGIMGNSIYGNVKLGIDLGENGVRQNVYPRGPSKPLARPTTGLPDIFTEMPVNYGQNFPLLHYASVGINSVVSGALTLWSNTQYRIEIFVSDTVDPSSYGEGKLLVGSDIVTTDAAGYHWFDISPRP